MKKINQNKEINQSHQSGIALVTTIILTSIMLASIVVTTKEMVDEALNSIRLNNSLIAYYAAEAGVEDGLLQFRFDHDAEISKDNDNDSTKDVTATLNNTPRTVNISTNTIGDYTTKNPSNSYYDLTMWNKVPCLVTAGDPNPFNCTTISPIKSDDTFEFSVNNIGSNNLALGFIPRANPNPDELGNGYRVEVTVIDENGIVVAKKFTCPADNSVSFSSGDLGLNGPTGKKTFRVKPWYVQYTPSADNSNCNSPGATNLPVSPDYPYIHLAVNKVPNAQLISGPVTTIQSVGYYGGVQRKIIETLDHSSGNIIGIYDYVIYSGSDLIK